jgi:hypothetical protein
MSLTLRVLVLVYYFSPFVIYLFVAVMTVQIRRTLSTQLYS